MTNFPKVAVMDLSKVHRRFATGYSSPLEANRKSMPKFDDDFCLTGCG
ncbi:MAG TPA: hypothetical protein PKJ76_09705 [Flexilinea sp.]|jgi:hypothetical protein|nr:hypothetical protein [Flexilinea sp.]